MWVWRNFAAKNKQLSVVLKDHTFLPQFYVYFNRTTGVVISFSGHSYNSVSMTQLGRLSLGASNLGNSRKLTTKQTKKVLQT